MKAVRVEKFGDEKVLEVKEIEKVKPKAREILVKVAAAGINPVDTYIRLEKSLIYYHILLQ